MNSKAYSSSFIQFLTLNSFGKLVLNPKATSVIKSLTAPLSIVSMIGPTSSGKSFLLNSLVNEFNSICHSSQQLQPNSSVCVSSKPLLGYNQDGKITSILLFDTPGLQFQKQDSDPKLMTLMFLISTSVFYNSKTPFSHQLIEEMRRSTNLLDLSPSFSKHFSKNQFNFIFRDFDKKIQNQFGVTISERQYFQNYLLSLANNHDNAVNAIKTHLPQRNCHFFIKPSFDQHDQHPLFWEQLIKLRKSLTDLPSIDIQGSDFILLLSTYIQSLNNNDSLQKVIQQGADCLTRIRCLDRLNDQLKSLEQRSMNSIDGIEQKLLDIKFNLHEYFKQRMTSTKQIQALDQQLAEIFHEFRQLNQIKSSPQTKPVEFSPHNLYVKISKPQKMARDSFNIDESDVQRNDEQKSMLSFTRIHTSKAIQSRLQECEAKLYRYELQTDMIRNQAGYFKEEYQKSRKELDCKQDQLEQILVCKTAKQKEYEMKLCELEEKLKTLQKQNLFALSQNEKLTLLSNDKISYLEAQMAQLSQCYKRQSEQREQKYKSKINEYGNEIVELNKAHEEEIFQLKLIYKSNMDKMVECNSNNSSRKLIKTGTQPNNNIDQLTQDIAKYKTTINQLQSNLASLTQRLKANEEKIKGQAEKAQKRVKEMQMHLQNLHHNQINEKELIIKELQTKNSDLLRKIQQAESNFQSMSQQLNNTIRGLKHELLRKSETDESVINELGKCKNQMGDYARELQQREYALSQAKIKIESCTKNIEASQKQKHAMQLQNKSLRQQIESINYENNLEIQKLQQAIDNIQQQNQNTVNNKARQIEQLKKLHQLEKQNYLTRIEDLSQELDAYRPYKYHYQDLQLTTTEKDTQFTQTLLDNQNTISSLKQQLEETEQQLTHKQQHVAYLANSLAELNEQYTTNCGEYSINLEELERHCSDKINGYIIEITELRAQLNEMKNQHERAMSYQQKKQKQYQNEIISLKNKCKQEEQKAKQNQTQLQYHSRQTQCEQPKHVSREVQIMQRSNYRPNSLQMCCNQQPTDHLCQHDQQQQTIVQPKFNISICNFIESNNHNNNDQMLKTAQLQIQKQQLAYQLRLLRDKMETTIDKYNHQLSAKNIHIQQLQQAILTLKNNNAQQILRAKEQLAALREELKVREAERAVLVQNIDAIQAKHRSEKQKNQNYVCLLERRMREVKQQKQRLLGRLQEYKCEYSALQCVKRSVEFNYNRDSSLWAHKLNLLEQKLNKS